MFTSIYIYVCICTCTLLKKYRDEIEGLRREKEQLEVHIFIHTYIHTHKYFFIKIYKDIKVYVNMFYIYV